jgi:6-phosphogluconolactonase
MKTLLSSRKNLEIKAAQLIKTKIHKLLKSQDQVVLAIPGGTSYKGIFSLLKNQNIPWQKVHIFMLDERFVSLDNKESNYGLAYNGFIRFLFKQKKLPHRNVHPFIYHKLPKDQALRAYKTELKEISHKFDICLLAAGEDGHVASLFPNHETIRNPAAYFITTQTSPKSPRKRLTASRKLIQRSKFALLLFFGKHKQKAYENFKNPSISIVQCPAKLANSVEDVHILSDIKL